MNIGVSIVILYRDRQEQIVHTLESIARQNYAPLEVIVVEDGDDGVMAATAKQFGVRHLKFPRGEEVLSSKHQYWTKNPPFGNLCILRNEGLREASHDIVIFQDAEVKHDTNVIGELAEVVAGRQRLLLQATLKYMKEDGSFWWRSHPVHDPCPGAGWRHIGSANCIQKATVRAMGGFEELFAGYGYDDDYFYYQLVKNDIALQVTPDVVCTHQWHTGIPFDHPTGHANRAIIQRLMHERESGLRPSTANYRSRDVLDSEFATVDRSILDGLMRGANKQDPFFNYFAAGWLAGVEDEHGNVAREMSERMKRQHNDFPAAEGLAALAEAAWGLSCAERAWMVGAEEAKEQLLAWACTAATVAKQGRVLRCI